MVHNKVIDFMINMYKERQHIKTILTNNKKYLVSGNYYIAGGSKRVAYLNSYSSTDFITKNNVHVIRKTATNEIIYKKFLKYILHKFSVIKVIGKDQKLNFAGEVVMFTRANDFKVFDFYNHKVMTFVKEKDHYFKIKDTIHVFKGKFPITIIDFNDIEQAYIEDYIDFVPYQDWSHQERRSVLNNIFRYYENYFKQTTFSNLNYVSTKSLIDLFIKDISSNNLLEDIYKILDYEDLAINWPMLRLHGDLGFNNILLSSNRIFFIDWEDSRDHIFFYDLLNIIFFEYVFHNDESYLEKYINGYYDDILKILFELMNIRFSSQKKLNYFAIFLIERVISEKRMNYPHLPNMIKLCQNTLWEIERVKN